MTCDDSREYGNYFFSFFTFQKFSQLFGGTPTMADGILVGGWHLCKAACVAFWLEDWVIAKALVAVVFREDFTLDDTFKEMFLSFIY